MASQCSKILKQDFKTANKDKILDFWKPVISVIR